MSWHTMAWARDVRARNANTKSVLMVLAEFTNDDNTCWPSLDTIAYATQLSKSTIQRCIKVLEADGFLRRDHRSDDAGHRTTDKYSLLVTLTSRPIPTGQIDPLQAVPTGQQVTTEHQEEPEHQPLSTVPAVIGYDSNLVPLRVTALPRNTYPTEFNKTYEVYPRRESKKAAYRAWRATVLRHAPKGRDEQLEVMRRILRGVRAYAVSVDGKETQFIKQPATFFGPDDHWVDLEPKASTGDWKDRLPEQTANFGQLGWDKDGGPVMSGQEIDRPVVYEARKWG